MALNTDPNSRGERRPKPDVSDSTKLIMRSKAPEKSAAMLIADDLVEKLRGHERTKKLLLAELRNQPDNEAFGVEESRRKAEKNRDYIIARIGERSLEHGIDPQQTKEALLASLEIDELQQQLAQKSYDTIVPYEATQVIQTQDIEKILDEISKDPELLQEVYEILEMTNEMGTGILGIRRMDKSTEARQFALKIYQEGLMEEFLEAYQYSS